MVVSSQNVVLNAGVKRREWADPQTEGSTFTSDNRAHNSQPAEGHVSPYLTSISLTTTRIRVSVHKELTRNCAFRYISATEPLLARSGDHIRRWERFSPVR